MSKRIVFADATKNVGFDMFAEVTENITLTKKNIFNLCYLKLQFRHLPTKATNFKRVAKNSKFDTS